MLKGRSQKGEIQESNDILLIKAENKKGHYNIYATAFKIK
jgi:hypothetical protein